MLKNRGIPDGTVQVDKDPVTGNVIIRHRSSKVADACKAILKAQKCNFRRVPTKAKAGAGAGTGAAPKAKAEAGGGKST